MRRLYADGREFAWTGQICHQAGERDRHALQADLLSKTVLPWGCAADDSHPTPKDVRTVIDYALAHGWDPDLLRGTSFLSESEHASAFELADLLLTDRLRDGKAPDPSTRVLRAFDENPRPYGAGLAHSRV
ncbi:hypothetical protein GCM10023195_81220 [Actinoallomurus liliacearum]|uniref:Uncharacterized protein n=1 Tax=Actinoallomurus liliacearum TaxID=1080073 RepID=A0ABP8TY66_9ACTN